MHHQSVCRCKPSNQQTQPSTHAATRIKIVLLGDSSVGKTTLLTRLMSECSSSCSAPEQAHSMATVLVDFKDITRLIDGKKYKIQVWDTAGQERYHTITSTYIRGAHGVVLVYDSSKPGTFERAKRWMDEISKVVGNQQMPVICLVANKIDVPQQQPLVKHDQQQHAPEHQQVPQPQPQPQPEEQQHAQEQQDVQEQQPQQQQIQPPAQPQACDTQETHTTMSTDTHTDTTHTANTHTDTPITTPLTDTTAAAAYAQQHNMLFYVASAKTGYNVSKMFESVFVRVVRERSTKLQPATNVIPSPVNVAEDSIQTKARDQRSTSSASCCA